MKYQKKVKEISTNALTKDLINKSSILNGSKYFSSGLFQNYFVFIPAKEYIKYFSGNIHINSLKSDSLIAPTFADHYILPNH